MTTKKETKRIRSSIPKYNKNKVIDLLLPLFRVKDKTKKVSVIQSKHYEKNKYEMSVPIMSFRIGKHPHNDSYFIIIPDKK